MVSGFCATVLAWAGKLTQQWWYYTEKEWDNHYSEKGVPVPSYPKNGLYIITAAASSWSIMLIRNTLAGFFLYLMYRESSHETHSIPSLLLWNILWLPLCFAIGTSLTLSHELLLFLQRQRASELKEVDVASRLSRHALDKKRRSGVFCGSDTLMVRILRKTLMFAVGKW
jgi:hypothetical protein